MDKSAHTITMADRLRRLVTGDALQSGTAALGGMDTPLRRPPAWRRYGPYILGATCLILIVLWLLFGIRGRVYRVPVNRVTLGTVTEGPFEDFIVVRASAAPFTTNYLTADQGGAVEQVLAEDGATVKAGQPLIILANTPLQLQVASREADAAGQINALDNTKLQLEETRFKYEHDLLDIEHQLSRLKGNLTRDKVLLDGNAIAPATYKQEEEEYAYELKLREATLASRDAEQKMRANQLSQLQKTFSRLSGSMATAKASLDALTIRAPIDGQLTALDAEVGQSKAQGAVLGQIDSSDRFKLIAQVDEFYLRRVVVGQIALFNTDGQDHKAKVAKIYPQIVKGTFKVDLGFEGPPPRGLHTGQAIDIKLELGGAAEAMMLPNGLFYQDTGGNWAFVVAPDGRFATRRNIRLGRKNPQYVEVLEGLQPGERVVISGYEALLKVDHIEFEKPEKIGP